MPSRVTSRAVAEKAGVSRSAVSRVFTPGASVAPKTAEKVRKIAAELGYRPNILARGLLTGRSRMIGLVVAYLDNQFYPGALEKLSAALEDQGYHVLIFMAAQTADNIEEVAEDILDYQIDGLILASVALSSPLAQRCRARGVPVMLFNRHQGDDQLSVTSDNEAGGRMAARHLIARGARKIGHIAGWEGASTQADREAGFLSELHAAGLTLHAREVGDFHPERARDAARRIFAGPDRPDAVFVANDYMAFPVMDVIRFEMGLRIPEDVAVIGFDDVPVASWPSYDLTTIRQDSTAMVRATVDGLLSSMDGARPRASLIPVELIKRSSA
ncbi:LacI family DNA-binding transcriptional regulator [Cognatishimia sp. MH4019]|uniref:LacI family DNA-binding transcriptional regulator n=1 Tax=Cognatishimia sp. MH4019 TaxID=2854030 RepID=UPI001CD3C443|nr:LacI family DNA-binding transcriptional regulator [Cognatishimia sp. MH4019]